MLKKLRLDERTYLILLALVVGLLGGVGNIVFRSSVTFFHALIQDWFGSIIGFNSNGLTALLTPIFPILGAILLIPLALIFKGEVYGYRFPSFLESVNLKGGIIKKRTLIPKFLAPAITIGSGGSAGIEGPIAQIGGTIGSAVGQYLRMSGVRMKSLIACGSAAGIAATFNAPITGILFAVEIILLGDLELGSFGAIVISSGVATVISRGIYGTHPAFLVPQYELKSFSELLLYIPFGIIIGLLAVTYIQVFYEIKGRFERLNVNQYIKPIIGAFLFGIIAIRFPQIMGNGYEYIQKSLYGELAMWTMLILLFLKIIGTATILGSGGAGGVFAPALYIGAMAGGFYGRLANRLFPAITHYPMSYAMVGMGAFLAASVHAPLTAIFLLFEMTESYMVVLPIMFSSIIGVVVAKRLKEDSIDTEELSKMGIDLQAGREASIMNSLLVRDVMQGDVVTIPENLTMKEILNLIPATRHDYFPVVNREGEMTGIMSLQDIRSVIFEEGLGKLIVAKELATETVITVTPLDNLNIAMERFSIKNIESLPVVEAGNLKRVIGFVRRVDVIRAYNTEVIRRFKRGRFDKSH